MSESQSDGTDQSYWRSYEGRLNQAIRVGLREAGVMGQLAHMVGPILAEVLKVAPEERER